jgi:hypothetical protein
MTLAFCCDLVSHCVGAAAVALVAPCSSVACRSSRPERLDAGTDPFRVPTLVCTTVVAVPDQTLQALEMAVAELGGVETGSCTPRPRRAELQPHHHHHNARLLHLDASRCLHLPIPKPSPLLPPNS